MDVAAIGEAVDAPRVAVEGEDDRFVGREDLIEFLVGEAVGVFGRGLQGHEVNDVDHADLEVGDLFAEKGDGGQGFEGGYVSAAGHDHVRACFGIRTIVC